MGHLVDHAKAELTRAGLFDKDSDYDGMLGTAVMELMEKFAEQGHSGFSAHLTIDLFQRLAKFQTLTPITSDPSEWMCVSEYFSEKKKGVWQNLRNPACFSEDGGKTWYNIDELHNKLSFKLKRRIRWFFQDVAEFVKYRIFRVQRPKVEPLTECCATPVMPTTPEENKEK